MFIDFMHTLKKFGVPASTKELLDFIAGLQSGIVFANVDDFYHFAKCVFVKDERFYQKFDNINYFYLSKC